MKLTIMVVCNHLYVIATASLLLLGVSAHAQNERNNAYKDSIHTEHHLDDLHAEPLLPANDIVTPSVSAAETVDPLIASSPSAINPKAVEIQRPLPYLYRWNNGLLTGSHYTTSNLTAVRNIAGVTAIQQWGKLSVDGSLSLSKGIGNGVGVVNGADVSIHAGYRLSDNVILHALGGVNRSGFLGPAPNATGAYYGGYVTLLTNNGKWGMDVGVRRVYNAYTGRWETIPIAMPYYNLNGAKLGIDVGGLLYSFFAGVAESSHKNSAANFDPNRGPAIIAPPIETMPHFDAIETPRWVEKQYERQ